MTVNVLVVPVTSLFGIEDQIEAALHGRKVYNTPTLLAVIDCGDVRTSDLGRFMHAALDHMINDRSLETEGGGELVVMGVCQPADVNGVVNAYWSDDITGPRPKQVFVVLYGDDRQVLPYHTELRQLIQSQAF